MNRNAKRWIGLAGLGVTSGLLLVLLVAGTALACGPSGRTVQTSQEQTGWTRGWGGMMGGRGGMMGSWGNYASSDTLPGGRYNRWQLDAEDGWACPGWGAGLGGTPGSEEAWQCPGWGAGLTP